MISAAQAQGAKDAARELGFDLAAFASVDVPAADRDFFLDWCGRGLAADMGWLARDPARRADPTAFLPGALGVVTLGVRYYQGPVPPAPAEPSGRVARYAWGRDYHEVIAARVERLAERLKDEWGPGLLVRSGLDAQPILERAFARRSGLGFAGKNTNVIAPRTGSWIFLAELVVNRELPADAPVAQGCGGCTQCQNHCPTGALDTAYQLDARLCIAYHTIENRGWIPRELRAKMGAWLFGCDDCQEVCPFNARAQETRWPEFRAEEGVGPWVSLREILSLRTPEQFKARFKGTPLLRAKRAGLLRNAAIVAANTGAAALAPDLERCLSDDAEPVVRGHAAWALGRIGSEEARQALEEALEREPDEGVRGEIETALGYGKAHAVAWASPSIEG